MHCYLDVVTKFQCSLGPISSDSCYSFYLEVDDTKKQNLFIQVKVTFATLEGDVVERVLTKKIETTDNVEIYERFFDFQSIYYFKFIFFFVLFHLLHFTTHVICKKKKLHSAVWI